MPVKRFPDPRITSSEGLLAVGGDLHPETLLLAYRQGIFPWPHDEDTPLLWFCPPRRAILEFAELHLPRSLERSRRRTKLEFSLDRDFPSVIRACARIKRPGQRGTWILPQMVDAYIEMHRLGHAHSCEAWDGDRLVGGIYGVSVDGAFAGESMFHLEPDASKLALLALVDHLRSRGLDWMDIQTMTPHMQALGAREIPRDEFLARLGETARLGLRLFP